MTKVKFGFTLLNQNGIFFIINMIFAILVRIRLILANKCRNQ